MPSPSTPTLHLPANQTRVIHAARHGVRLKVVAGRLWLTQPHARQDLMLRAGEEVDLLQDGVVIGTDAEPLVSAAQPPGCEYQLRPMPALVRPAAGSRGWRTAWRRAFRSSGDGPRAATPLEPACLQPSLP